MTAYDYVAFLAMAVVVCGIVYMVIWLGDLPAKIAKERHHPQVAAVRAMAWLGLLFTGGIVYIFAFVWAYYDYSASRSAPKLEIESLRKQVAELRAEFAKRG